MRKYIATYLGIMEASEKEGKEACNNCDIYTHRMNRLLSSVCDQCNSNDNTLYSLVLSNEDLSRIIIEISSLLKLIHFPITIDTPSEIREKVNKILPTCDYKLSVEFEKVSIDYEFIGNKFTKIDSSNNVDYIYSFLGNLNNHPMISKSKALKFKEVFNIEKKVSHTDDVIHTTIYFNLNNLNIE